MQPHRRLILAVLPVLALLAGAATAQARIVELGELTGASTPTCPGSPCLAVSRTTGYQDMVGKARHRYRVPANGRLVAWTIALGDPNAKQIEFFDNAFGESSAAITVLRRGKKRLQRFTVGEGPVQKLEPYFGQIVQFPLRHTIRVHRRDLIGLTVPTWAPALSHLLSDGSAWLASRPRGGCEDTDTQTAQLQVGPATRYRCRYSARLTYSATLVTSPQPTAK